jgi:putative two-component system response regulator
LDAVELPFWRLKYFQPVIRIRRHCRLLRLLRRDAERAQEIAVHVALAFHGVAKIAAPVGRAIISFIRELRTFPQFAEIPFVMITSIEDDEVRMKALEAGAIDFLPKRPQSLEMQIRMRNLIRLGIAVRKLNDRAADLASEVAAATRKLQEREEEIILRLALAVEYRDNDTGEHTLRVARYSRVIAEQPGLSPRLCRDIYLAAPLHDVGKVAIPDRILLKPGRLDADEIAMICTHAGIGGRILATAIAS